jgi:GNAT superfamily N-acetyltransferase
MHVSFARSGPALSDSGEGRRSNQPGIRLLTERDLPAAMRLSVLAGWNQTADDWRLLLDLAPDGCFCLEVDGIVAASATLLSYEQRAAWIGMVLTDPEYRRRGLARQLVTHALARADALGTRTIKLDATEEGQPLYVSLGFVPEQPIERWFRPGPPAAKANAHQFRGELSRWFGADSIAFGTDRKQLLQKLTQRGQCFSSEKGYLLTRPGRTTAYLGPCVSRDLGAARELFQLAIQRSAPGGWSWDLFPHNDQAAALAKELGFVPHRRLMRMFRGERLRGKDELIYAVAGFEFG